MHSLTCQFLILVHVWAIDWLGPEGADEHVSVPLILLSVADQVLCRGR